MLLLRSHTPLRLCLRHLSNSAVTLSGHNKWSKIKEGKGASDKAKSKTYGRANREILNAVKKGDSADPALNSALAAAVSKAKAAGVPKVNIQAALEQASKTEANVTTQEFQYETMFAGKVGLIIICRSDNSTRTIRELKDTFREHGAQLTTVSYMFEKKALIQVVLTSSASFEELLLDSLDSGALDVTDKEPGPLDGQRVIQIATSPDNCGKLVKALQNLGYTVVRSEIAYLPLDTGVTLDNKTRDAVRAFIEKIEENSDVCWIHVSPQV